MDEVKWRLYVNKQIFMRFERLLIEHKLFADKEQRHVSRKKGRAYSDHYGRHEPPHYGQYTQGYHQPRNAYLGTQHRGYDRHRPTPGYYAMMGPGAHYPPPLERKQSSDKPTNRF